MNGGHKARKRFGQNFLSDANIIARIVDAIDPQAGDHMVEIGPGQAALTLKLLERLDSLDVIEIDRDLVLQAAMLKVNPATALLLMRDFITPESDDWLLQNAANSAVGILINRLAAANGWQVANIVRSDVAAEKVKAAGGRAVVIDGPDLVAQVREATSGGRVRLGIDALLFDEVKEYAIKQGYRQCEASLLLEDNHLIVSPSEFMGAQRYKTWRIYDLPLE